MSSSGQAPNVSMDELLSSIKSMIEGESSGLANSQDQTGAGAPPAGGANDPLSEGTPLSDGTMNSGPIDDGVMDLTQVVQTPPAAQPHQNQDLAGDVQQPQQGQVPQGQGGTTARDAANQINDILGGMNADLGLDAVSPDAMSPTETPDAALTRGGDAQIDPLMQEQNPGELSGMQPYPGDVVASGDVPKGLDPMASGEMASDEMGTQDPGQLGASEQPLQSMMNDPLADSAGGQPLSQGDASLARGLGGDPIQAQVTPETPFGADGQMADKGMPQPHAGQAGGLPPQDISGLPPQGMVQGQPVGQQFAPQGQPIAQQGAGQGLAPQQQQPLGYPQPPQAGVGFPAQQPGGMPPQGHMAGVPHGQTDQRLESEVAMGQALSQADMSLNAAQGLQNPGQNPMQPKMHPPHDGGMAMRGLHPQGGMQEQLPAVAGGGLPVLHGGPQLPASQPMMMPVADPSVDQLPLEMRNNLEEIVKQLLKPLLREWLERNLPELLKGAIDDQGKIDPNRL